MVPTWGPAASPFWNKVRLGRPVAQLGPEQVLAEQLEGEPAEEPGRDAPRPGAAVTAAERAPVARAVVDEHLGGEDRDAGDEHGGTSHGYHRRSCCRGRGLVVPRGLPVRQLRGSGGPWLWHLAAYHTDADRTNAPGAAIAIQFRGA